MWNSTPKKLGQGPATIGYGTGYAFGYAIVSANGYAVSFAVGFNVGNASKHDKHV